MTTRKQKLTLVISILAAFALGMATVSGCAYFTEEKVAGIALLGFMAVRVWRWWMHG